MMSWWPSLAWPIDGECVCMCVCVHSSLLSFTWAVEWVQHLHEKKTCFYTQGTPAHVCVGVSMLCVLFIAPGCFLVDDHIESSAWILDARYKYYESEFSNTLCSGSYSQLLAKSAFTTLHCVFALYKTYRSGISSVYCSGLTVCVCVCRTLHSAKQHPVLLWPQLCDSIFTVWLINLEEDVYCWLIV